MLYYFKEGKNTTETQNKICAVYGEGAVTDRTCQKWFAKKKKKKSENMNRMEAGDPNCDNWRSKTTKENRRMSRRSDLFWAEQIHEPTR